MYYIYLDIVIFQYSQCNRNMGRG